MVRCTADGSPREPSPNERTIYRDHKARAACCEGVIVENHQDSVNPSIPLTGGSGLGGPRLCPIAGGKREREKERWAIRRKGTKKRSKGPPGCQPGDGISRSAFCGFEWIEPLKTVVQIFAPFTMPRPSYRPSHQCATVTYTQRSSTQILGCQSGGMCPVSRNKYPVVRASGSRVLVKSCDTNSRRMQKLSFSQSIRTYLRD